MTPLQRVTLQQLQAQDFRLVDESTEVVRVTRNGDNRVILRDGSQKRGQHVGAAKAAHHSQRRGKV